MRPREARSSSTTRMRASSLIPSTLARVALEEDRDLRLVGASFGNPHDHLQQVVWGRHDLRIVEAEERGGADQPCPLVPIHERVVADDMEQVCGSHLGERWMEPLAAE